MDISQTQKEGEGVRGQRQQKVGSIFFTGKPSKLIQTSLFYLQESNYYFVCNVWNVQVGNFICEVKCLCVFSLWEFELIFLEFCGCVK